MIRIVVVEDELPIQVGLKKLISQLSPDYQVVGAAAHSHEAMAMIKSLQPDLVLCDIRLGKENGLEMIETLNASGITTKYVIISGYSEFSYAQKAIKLGVIDYLVKPVSAKQIAQLLRVFAEQTQQPTSPVGQEEPQGGAYSQLVAHTLQIIQTSYASDLSLSSIADEAGITAQYLSALFSKEVGTSFVCYLRNYRMQKAQQLLQETHKKISDIAFAVGYEDPQYFCRVFKSLTNCSPKHFRYEHMGEGTVASGASKSH